MAAVMCAGRGQVLNQKPAGENRYQPGLNTGLLPFTGWSLLAGLWSSRGVSLLIDEYKPESRHRSKPSSTFRNLPGRLLYGRRPIFI